MIRIAVYGYGMGTRVRIEDHFGDAESECNDNCEEYAVERSDGRKGESDAEYRVRVVAAVGRALERVPMSHREFSLIVHDGARLF